MDVRPDLLLTHPQLVLPVAPWCSWLDNQELVILLLAQPWLAGEGLRRSELQEQLERMAGDLPIGPVYFQRISRAAEALVARGQLSAEGGGRSRRYRTTVGGFAALLLNLQVLRADPTLDGSEFELKRALVALWNLVTARLGGLAGGIAASPEMGELLEQLSGLKVWNRAVITDEVVVGAFDILRLIHTQRERLAALEQQTRARQEAIDQRYQLVQAPVRPRRAARVAPSDLDDTLAVVGVVATGVAPRLQGEAALLRYRAYAHYLDGLEKLYARELPLVDLASVRRALGSKRR
jgi:hypothetical protein